MQLAVDCAGFTAAEADQLRQAMGSKRSQARMARMRERLMAGMAERGITGDTAEEIYTKLRSVLELRLPREPLGELRLPRVFELVDQVPLSRRVRGRVVERAADGVLLAAHDRARRAPSRRARARSRPQRVRAATPRSNRARSTSSRSAARCAASTPNRRTSRCGSGCAACAGCTTRCSTTSTTSAPSTPFADLEDFVRRTGATVDQVEALATAGAFEHCFGQSRRGRVVGRGRARHRAARTRGATARSSRRCPASSPAPTRPRCRA